ncbi:CbtA family protein, partial [Pseudomonas viridiflava]
MFKRIAYTAGFTGLLAALLLTLLQSFWVVPLIQQAETYENAPAEHIHEAVGVVAEHSHEHDEAAWEPENGWQRV